ncbi:MAG: FAD-dependent oxidoreductase [Verrucomicrobia bacterium]|nr:FAD-dependent oxidoreductase [Verrucomicrobiota bacterium]
MRTRLLIIGGGPTGLGAATRAGEHGMDWQLLEAADTPGGLASSFVDEHGFTWDLGGHVQFSHYKTFDRHMDLALGPDGWIEHQRESWIRFKNRWVPYPFQLNLHRLDPADRDRCLAGLQAANGDRPRQNPGKKTGTGPVKLQGVKRGQAPKNMSGQTGTGPEKYVGSIGDRPRNFGEWVLSVFGEGIAELFMNPYNFKVWACPLERMDHHWIGERVAVPEMAQVMRSIRSGEDHKSWGPNATFRFPRHGGTGAVWKAVAAKLPAERCHYGDPVVRIDPVEKIVETRSGLRVRYQELLSTLPLDDLIRLCPGVAPSETAGQLVSSATHIVGVGLWGQAPSELSGKCWMYFPEAHSPYYRVTQFSHYSPNNVPRPGEQWSLMAEISESPHKPVEKETLVADTLRALTEDGLIPDTGAVIGTTHRRLPKGYPTPFLGRDQVVDPVLRAFEKKDIYSRGRFGAWKYEVSNQDHSFAQGYECVERLHQGGGKECEPTLHRPAWVNGRVNE